MSTIIISIILAVIFLLGVKNFLSKISHGCCGSSGDSNKKIKPSDKNRNNYPYVYKIDIDGMTCSHCKLTIENAFNENDGFYAEVSLKNKNAIVRAKKDIPETDLKRIVQRKGYTVISINPVHI